MSTSSPRPLIELHDLVMFDLDGVVYAGPEAVPGAPEQIERARTAGADVAFVTNSAARTPDEVARHLTRLGVPTAARDVVTSAQAAAHLLAARLPEDSPVFVLGSPALALALETEGLRPVSDRDAGPVAVVSGYGPDLRWSTLMVGAVLVRDGVPWIACNTDLTVPMPYGTAPGHGAQVDLIRRFSGAEPVVAGKPLRPLFDETVRRRGGRSPLVVGDRLDTDIEGANAAGLESLLVLTGVTGLAELVCAPPALRPTHIARDLRGLFEPQPSPRSGALGAWRASVSGAGHLEIRHAHLGTDGRTPPPAGDDDWWRLAAWESWRHLDATGTPVDPSSLLSTASGSVPAEPFRKGTVSP